MDQTIRAKFKVVRIESQMLTRSVGSLQGTGTESVEVRNVMMQPVLGDSEENLGFWVATPSGQITLGTVNPDVWKQFTLGEEYYVDFSPAYMTVEAGQGGAIGGGPGLEGDRR